MNIIEIKESDEYNFFKKLETWSFGSIITYLYNDANRSHFKLSKGEESLDIDVYIFRNFERTQETKICRIELYSDPDNFYSQQLN